jgi:hypothetical protein
VGEGRDMRVGVGWGHLNIRIRPEDLGIDVRIILKRFLNKLGGCGLGTSFELLCTR